MTRKDEIERKIELKKQSIQLKLDRIEELRALINTDFETLGRLNVELWDVNKVTTAQ